MTLKATLIHIPRPSSACLLCQIDFVEGNEYCSVVQGDDFASIKPKDSMQRSDFCLSCWQKLRSENSSQVQGANWKSRVAANKQTQPKAQKRIEIAMELLKYAPHENPYDLTDSEIFFLALYLARQRQLLFRQEIDNAGQQYQLFEVADTEEVLAVKKIDLRKADLNMLQSSLAKRLHVES